MVKMNVFIGKWHNFKRKIESYLFPILRLYWLELFVVFIIIASLFSLRNINLFGVLTTLAIIFIAINAYHQFKLNRTLHLESVRLTAFSYFSEGFKAYYELGNHSEAINSFEKVKLIASLNKDALIQRFAEQVIDHLLNNPTDKEGFERLTRHYSEKFALLDEMHY